MRQNYRAGEKMFVDYAGQTMQWVDSDTGEVLQAPVFVAVLGASNYVYAEAQPSQRLECWIEGHCNAFEFFRGLTQVVVPDNTRTGVSKPCYYEPDLNPTYQDMALLTPLWAVRRRYAGWKLPGGCSRLSGIGVRHFSESLFGSFRNPQTGAVIPC